MHSSSSWPPGRRFASDVSGVRLIGNACGRARRSKCGAGALVGRRASAASRSVGADVEHGIAGCRDHSGSGSPGSGEVSGSGSRSSHSTSR